MRKKKITVVNDFIGYHQYAQAPEDVAFLRAWHRHHFIIKTSLSVEHNDRDIEFFELQDKVHRFILQRFGHCPTEELEDYLPGIFLESCEHCAEELVNYLKGETGRNFIEVSVSEDSECEATVTEEEFY